MFRSLFHQIKFSKPDLIVYVYAQVRCGEAVVTKAAVQVQG